MRIRLLFFSLVTGAVVGSAQAAMTLAAWEDFSGAVDGTLRQHGVTLSLQGNSVAADGSVTIGARGLCLTRACGPFGNAARGAGMGVMVIAEVSDVPVPANGVGGLLSVPISDILDTWAGIGADGKVQIAWGANAPTVSSSAALGPGAHVVAFGYRNNYGSSLIVDGVELPRATACSGGALLKSEIHIGEHKTYDASAPIAGVLTGMKISKLALVDGILSADEVTAYCANGIGRPDARQRADYARYQADFADRVFTWRAADWNMSSGTYGRFDPAAGTDAGDLVGGMDEVMLPGCSTRELFWHGICDFPGVITGYCAPGLVLRFPVHGGDYSTSCLAQFPLYLGGLLVEEGAFGGTYNKDNTITVRPITFASDGNARTTDLGDPSGTCPSWFVLHEDVVVNRGGETRIRGEANFSIDVNKSLDCTSANAAAVVSLQAGASLVCRGAGRFKVRTLTATAENCCLDWSGWDLDNGRPFIDGNLAVGASTRLVLPAAAKAAKKFTLCSGTLSGTFPDTIQVGDETTRSFTVGGNTLILSTVTEFTGEGETGWNSPAAWSEGVPQRGDVARIPSGRTVLVTAADNLAGVGVVGDGRVVYAGCQPGSERSAYCEPTWQGTVEIRDLDLSGQTGALAQTLDFAGFSNEKSSVALNGVVSAMWANGSDIKYPTFFSLEIGERGWTSTTTWFTASPVYRCNLVGSGTLTSKQNETHGTVNFIGDHSAFAGAVVNTSGSRQIALLGTGAAPISTHTAAAGAPQVIRIGEGVRMTVPRGKTWQAARGFDIRGQIGGAGTLEGAVTFTGGAVRAGSGALVLEGEIAGTPAVDAQDIFETGAFEEVQALVARTEARPAFSVQGAPGFVAIWQEDGLWLRDEARIALYGNYAGASILTWAGTGTMGAAGTRYVGFDPSTRTDTAEVLAASDSWHVFWSGATTGTSYRPGAVLRLARGAGNARNIDDYVPWSFGGIIVEPGATGYSMTINNGTRDINIGDQADPSGVTWTTICEDFTVNRGPQGQGTFFGVCNLHVAEGKVFSFNANTPVKDNPVVHPGAVLKMQGGGTMKVSNLIARDATLDFSGLAAGRARPFLDGDLVLDKTTVLAFPQDHDLATPYRLCSGTLDAPAASFTATVVVAGDWVRKFVTVDGNCVTCANPPGCAIVVR